jgi:molecular chaperone DnaK
MPTLAPMSAAGVELGVDLGTSNTVAVMRGRDGRNRTLLFDGSPLLPSAVYAEPSGTIVVGRDAVHSARLEPARFEPNPKRRIDDGVVLLGDREVPIAELLGAVLHRVVDEFQRTMGGPVTPNVTITCPAAWGATRRLVLSDAAAAAGLGPVRLVPEPVAAATYFTQVLGKAVPVGSVVVVHDFGAGTFDASVVARTASGFEVLAVDGRDDIGGLDVDEAIIGFIQKIAVERDAAAWARLARPSTVDERRARRLLWDDVRIAKERLSRQPAADLNVPLLGIDVHLTRQELEGLAQSVVEQTIRVTQGVIRWAQLPPGRLAGVFLVGGSSRMPLVATLLHRALGEPPVVIDSPELVVAEGSLLAGAQAVPETGGRPVANPATGIHAPIFNPDGSLVYPELAGPGRSGAPVSGGPTQPPLPVGQTVVAGQLPVSGPSGPVSGAPGGYAPVSGAPGGYAPVSGAPGGYAPVSGPPGPVSGPPGRPTSSGAVYGSRPAPVDPDATQRVPPPVQPVVSPPVASTRVEPRQPDPRRAGPTGPATPVYPPGVSRPTYRESREPVREPHYEPPYRDSRYDDPAYAQPAARVAGSGAARRVLRTVLVTMLLILVPIICGYVAYRYTSDQPLLP